MRITLEQFGIDRLGDDERMELVDLILASVEGEQIPQPIPEWHLRELEKRIASADANPEAGIPWEVARARWLANP